MSDDIIYSTTAWQTNAQMIADVHRLGYLKDEDKVLDPTFGLGAWWRVWRPEQLVVQNWHDEGPMSAYAATLIADEPIPEAWDAGWDFRHMWYRDQCFDAVAFDPPYVSVGGRSTSGINGMHAAYGMDGAPLTPQGVQDDINAGLVECFRVVKKCGIVLVKCQSYVTSGKLYPGTFNTWMWAVHHTGFQLVDHLTHVSGPRPQPDRPQQHARRNSSDLLVLRRPRR